MCGTSDQQRPHQQHGHHVFPGGAGQQFGRERLPAVGRFDPAHQQHVDAGARDLGAREPRRGPADGAAAGRRAPNRGPGELVVVVVVLAQPAHLARAPGLGQHPHGTAGGLAGVVPALEGRHHDGRTDPLGVRGGSRRRSRSANCVPCFPLPRCHPSAIVGGWLVPAPVELPHAFLPAARERLRCRGGAAGRPLGHGRHPGGHRTVLDRRRTGPRRGTRRPLDRGGRACAWSGRPCRPVRRMLQEAGVRLGVREIIDALIAEVLRGVERHVPWRPGARELLADLDRHGVPCAMVTMSEGPLAGLVAAGLPAGTFRFLVTGDMVSVGQAGPRTLPAGAVHAAGQHRIARPRTASSRSRTPCPGPPPPPPAARRPSPSRTAATSRPRRAGNCGTPWPGWAPRTWTPSCATAHRWPGSARERRTRPGRRPRRRRRRKNAARASRWAASSASPSRWPGPGSSSRRSSSSSSPRTSPRALPGIGTLAAYLVALAYAVLLALSVLVHELAHAVSAKAFGWPGARIVLTLWGGHTQFGSFNATPGRSLMVAMAGPAANFILAGLGFAADRIWAPAGVTGLLLGILVWANFLVALFNVLPGLPLDGGRLVESAVWRGTGSQERGTLAAGWTGRVIAVGIAVYFLLLPALRGEEPNLQLIIVAVLIAGFLWSGASASIAQRPPAPARAARGRARADAAGLRHPHRRPRRGHRPAPDAPPARPRAAGLRRRHPRGRGRRRLAGRRARPPARAPRPPAPSPAPWPRTPWCPWTRSARN